MDARTRLLLQAFAALLIVSNGLLATEALDIRDYEAADVCEEAAKQVRVTVTNVGEGGILTVELYNDPDNFLNKKGRERRIRIPAQPGVQKVCFNIQDPGSYAVAAYHDIDGNRKLKKKWNMMPKEPFGLSNNPVLKMGFPKFKKSEFETGQLGADIVVNLKKP